MGGGTGICPCLRGLNEDRNHVTAIVTVADDGGSSGRLRKDYHIHPPGDIRNSLVALASADPLTRSIFDFRFDDSILKGHSFGNLLLAVLTRLTGDFRAAIDEARLMLSVRHTVLPSTGTRVVLVAGHPDGTKSTGEQVISKCGKPINHMALRPEPGRITEEVEGILAAADLVVLGPGSLYTSIIPNLLVPGMTETLAKISAPVVLVGNLMTQPGETDGFTLEDHVQALFEVGGLQRLDAVVQSSSEIPADVLGRYQEAEATPVQASRSAESLRGARLVEGDIHGLTTDGLIRHDGGRLAALLESLSTRGRGAGGN